MSDCFNHALDAFESQYWEVERYCKSSNSNFQYNSLFYHTKYKEIKLITQTDKAYLFKTLKGSFWIPKSLCRKYEPKKKSVYIWNKADIIYI